jgi:predicted regulator of Ras-like GTPase activity (Roadblock/LC7/MglB family)
MAAPHAWRFFRAGGFDQVRLDTADDLLALPQLDQKLWVALSCPVKGIEYDARTLELIDTDTDGRVRAPELLQALAWANERLLDSAILGQQMSGLPIAAIRRDDAVGEQMYAAATALAYDTGKTDADLLTVDEASAARNGHAAREQAAWEAAGQSLQVLGEGTEAGFALVNALEHKIEDYFVRCQLAAFDERAGPALNVSEDTLKAMASTALQASTQAISELPLAHVTAVARLSLVSGLNPAWASQLVALRDQVVLPLLGPQDALSEADWQAIKARFKPYADWLAAKPDPNAVTDGVLALERLARYVRDLHSLANNFVAFRDFYTAQGKASFQVGTLYLDGRSCDLCVAVNDAAKHAALAPLARICLVYCDCVRGAEKMSVAAAFTAGDSDQLMVGRNGVFYDRQGRDWDATIAKIIDHPISLRQAFWSPYKQLARLVSSQLQKMAASKAKASDDKLALLASDAAKKGGAPAPDAKAAAPAAFDVAKFAGIFAAIGLALGAIGTALAALLGGLFNLAWWQIPLVFVAVMLLISGPAVIVAWFKLRSRTLGPILDANGWSINARARINIPFGTSLTQLAQLPANAERSLADPYADKPSKAPYVLLALVVLALVLWTLRL